MMELCLVSVDEKSPFLSKINFVIIRESSKIKIVDPNRIHLAEVTVRRRFLAPRMQQ